MLKTYRKNLFVICVVAMAVLSSYSVAHGQQLNRIQSRCPSPNQLVKSQVSANSNGDILYIPCPSMSSIFSGNVDFTSATILGLFPVTTKGDLFTFSTVPARLGVGNDGEVLTADSGTATGLSWSTPATGVTGSGTLNFVPRFLTSTTNLADTPLSWNGTQYEFQNTALNSTFSLVFNPTTAGGIFSIGGGNPSYLALTQAPSLFRVIADNTNIATNAGGLIEMGDLNTAGSGLKFTIDENGSVVAVNNDLGTAWFTVPNIRVSNIVYNRNDCIAGSVLNLAGESDLSGSACWGAATSPVMFVSGNSAAGALRVQAGVVKSSLGAGDAGGTFNYVIIDVQ